MKTTIKIMALSFAAVSLTISGIAFAGTISCDGKNVPTKQMTISGANFQSYCLPCIAALRTYAREPVIDTVSAAFKALAANYPDTKFVYAEMGFPNGGQFKPHRTHREGLSVDIMVPLKDGKIINGNFKNRYGYNAEFNSQGVGEDGIVDFDALGSLFAALDIQAKKRGGAIRRVFFAPDMQPALRKAAPDIFKTIKFNTKQAWVRHDEHIHVDFEFSCEK